ncbi:uncharacterized protein [Haliotis asinina]|uniref:uncharacterized protein n=1 Tax=Haliotis asinina TaxID=109174 RepID=UPI003531B89A
MVGIILICVTGILSCITAVAPDSNQPTTQSHGPVNPSLTEGGSSSSSSAVNGVTSAASLTPSIRDTDSARSVELQNPVWIVWVDVNVPPNYGTQEIVMTTTNNDTVMPCNAMNTWVTSTTLRITCRNVVNATTIILVGTDSMASKLGLIEMYVYEDCQPGRYGQECGTLCSQNCTEGLCDDVNSTCTCVLGWKGDNCDGDTFNRSNKTHFPVDTSGPGINPVFAGVVGTEIAAVIVLLVVMTVLLVRRHRQHSQRTLQQDAYDDIFNDIPSLWNAQHSLEDQSSVDYDVIDVTSNDQDKEPNRPFADGTSESICEENHCESCGSYITTISREGETLAQNTGCGQTQSESPGSYDVLDVTSHGQDGLLDKPTSTLTTTQSLPEDDSKGSYDILDVTSRDPDETHEKPYTGLTINTQHQNITTTGRQESV